jgi:hypothetical protein
MLDGLWTNYSNFALWFCTCTLLIVAFWKFLYFQLTHNACWIGCFYVKWLFHCLLLVIMPILAFCSPSWTKKHTHFTPKTLNPIPKEWLQNKLDCFWWIKRAPYKSIWKYQNGCTLWYHCLSGGIVWWLMS